MIKKILIFLLIVICVLIVIIFTCCAPAYNIPKCDDIFIPADVCVDQDDNALVFMTISGGGTRAGTMGWATLENLKKIPYNYTKDGILIKSTLADQIDYISGISGGSFAATGWCLYKDSTQVFRKRFVEKNIQKALVLQLLKPWNMIRLLSPYYNRINIAAEYYDKNVFNFKKFKDLPSYPVLWINATSLAIGNRFVYTDEQFNMISSDRYQYPLGFACAASSAFPILLDPITLKNHGKTLPDSILKQDLTYQMALINKRKDIERDYYCKMIQFYNDKSNKWIHLADGGLVDNQGLQAIIDQFKTNGIINKRINDSENPLQKLIIINVNAGLNPDDKSSKKQSPPKIPSVINYTMTLSMDMLSAKRWMECKSVCAEMWKAALDSAITLKERPYCIEVGFRNIKNDSLRNECYKLPTSFYLNKKQIALIDSTVPFLINEDPDMKRLVENK